MLQTLLTHLSETHLIIAHLIVFFGMFIEGELLLVLAGILARTGPLNFWSLFAVAATAAFLHDIFYWRLGVWLSDRGREKIWKFNLKKVARILERLHNGRSGPYIMISKFIWNANRFILVSAGYLKMPLRRFIKWSAAAAITWSFFFLGLGYLFADRTDILRKDLKTASLFTAGLVVSIIIAEELVKKFVKNRVKKELGGTNGE